MPAVVTTYRLSAAQGALFITGSIAIFGLTQWLGGRILRVAPTRLLQIVMVIMYLLGGAIVIGSHAYGQFLMAMFLIAGGSGIANLMIAMAGPTLNPDKSVVVMSILGASYTVFGVGIQFFAGYFLQRGLSWRALYWLMLGLAGLRLWLGNRITEAPSIASSTIDKIRIQQGYHWPLLVFYMVMIGTYAGAEYAMANWLPSYLVNLGFSAAIRGVVLGMFLFARTLGIAFWIIFGDRIRSQWIITSCAGVIIVTLMGGITLGQTGIWLLAISGVGFSGIFPLMLTLLSHVQRMQPVDATGIVLAVGYLIAAGVNQMIGWLSDGHSIIQVFWLIPVLIGVTLGFGLIGVQADDE